MKHFFSEEIATSSPFPLLVKELLHRFSQKSISPPRQHLTINTINSFLVMPSILEEQYFGAKLASVFPENPKIGLETVQGLYCLFDLSNGKPLATFDASELTARRTAAASALASSFLSRENSRVLLILGSGKLVPYFIEAYQSVRPIKQVKIWARSIEKAATIVEQLRAKVELDIQVVGDLNDAINESDIITTLTSSKQPILKGSMMRAGVHIDLVGAHTTSMREADEDCFKIADVYVDTIEGTMSEAGDLIAAVRSGCLKKTDIKAEFSDLGNGGSFNRSSSESITLFKSVGTAIEDLAAASLVYNNWVKTKQ